MPPPPASPTTGSWTSTRYFLFLLWLSTIFTFCLLLFTSGFLLRRQVLLDKSVPGEHSPTPPFSKAVVILVDALKYDFARFNRTSSTGEHFLNKLPVLDELERSGHGRLFEFMADPPTTTMQRLKGLTTGSLPTFIDVSNNFGSYEVDEDNLIDQISAGGKRIVFMGDDTWMGLFPGRFFRHFPFPSFDVWDLDTVDRGVTRHLLETVPNVSDWDVIVAHYLGVDHAGHKFGPQHPEMARKLGEMNEVVSRVVAAVPDDCLVLVMGDHGMTVTGDHGGDSHDELSAALFAYNSRFQFANRRGEQSERKTVDQVDFVPTISLLLGIPIPFSNLGKLIPDLFETSSDGSDHFHMLSRKLEYLKTNVEQVMTYLDTYRSSGGILPQTKFELLRRSLESFRSDAAKPMSPERLDQVIAAGLQLLTECKAMCQSVWVKFDLNLMGAGITLFFIHLTLVLLLTLTPRNRLLTGILNTQMLINLALSVASGLALGCLLVASDILHGSNNNGAEIVIGCSATFSIMVFGFTLLWRLRKSLLDMVTLPGLKMTIHLLLLFGGFVALFSNSFVVEEAAVRNFCLITLLCTYVWEMRKSTTDNRHFSTRWTIVAVLLLAGLIRASNVYFRCREEQSSYCLATDFHKPIGTLPRDMKMYRQWRFFTTIAGVAFTVLGSRYFLTSCGNLNGISLAVSIASYIPPTAGLCMIAFWALQGHEVGSRLVPWQLNILAQLAIVLAFGVILVCLMQPRLLYLVHVKASGDNRSGLNLSGGMRDYYQYVKTNWRHFTSSSASSSGKKLIFGLGTAISAPQILIVVMLGLISMLLLGDGLCPSVALLLVIMAIFLYITTTSRLKVRDLRLDDIFCVPWTSIIGWFALEGFFFFASGHQPTFPSIQWSAAFVGFSGANYGGANVVLPAMLIGWNTFASRILFGMALPLLLLAPFALWIRVPSVKPPGMSSAATSMSLEQTAALATVGPLTTQDLEQGEVVLLDRPEEAKTQLFNLCCKYLVLQSLQLFGTMFAAAVLRRHLMVWKIFAPRFIFEAVGFLVSVVSVTLGYLVIARILGSLLKYYRLLEKDK